jgi:hypothetical protein
MNTLGWMMHAYASVGTRRALCNHTGDIDRLVQTPREHLLVRLFEIGSNDLAMKNTRSPLRLLGRLNAYHLS